MTPGQTQAFLSLAFDLRREDLADMLSIQALAVGSASRTKEDAEAIQRHLKQLSGG